MNIRCVAGIRVLLPVRVGGVGWRRGRGVCCFHGLCGGENCWMSRWRRRNERSRFFRMRAAVCAWGPVLWSSVLAARREWMPWASRNRALWRWRRGRGPISFNVCLRGGPFRPVGWGGLRLVGLGVLWRARSRLWRAGRGRPRPRGGLWIRCWRWLGRGLGRLLRPLSRSWSRCAPLVEGEL